VAERFHRHAAERLLLVLGQMKGVPMKLGQLLSYVDDFVPPAHRDVYRETLSRLQVLAQPVPWKTIEGVIRSELGASPDELFARVDEVPLAAASIGQVHRGALRDGTEVVLKVQYPGIAEAVRSDLENVELLRDAVSLILPRVDVEKSLSDVRARLLEECDYGCELCNQEEFARKWQGDPEVLVPRVFPELSSDRVLVSEYVQGLSWAEMRERAGAAERNRIARILYRFVFRSLYSHGMLNADPHPGNYVFLEDGRVAFLDFGCVQRYDEATVRSFVEIRRLVMAGVGGPRLREALTAGYGLPPLDDEEWSFTEEYVRCCFAPILVDRPFRYDRAYAERLADLTLKGALLFARKALRKGVSEARREGFVFLNRLTYGFASILVALEAEANWREEIEKIDAELATAAAGDAASRL
jgi:hypothetical protein